MADLNVALILKFVDQATRPARAAVSAVERMGASTQRLGAAEIATNRARIAAAQERQTQLLGEAGALAATGWAMTRAMQPAIAFEKKMAEVGKVVDFEASDGLAKLGQDIQRLVTDGGLPMAADGIAEIVAAAAQANLIDQALPDAEKRAQLLAFAEAAGKMGVAFDISAGEAGEAMAIWRSSLNLTQDEALSLGDAVNHLSNTIGAKAAALTDVIRRTGGVAKTAGLAAQDVAALGGAFLAIGAAPEVAATAMKNFTGALTAGEAITDRQAAILKKLGFNAVDLAKRMQVDAKGAILDVMRALGGLEKYEQGSAIRQLFGEEVTGSVTPLVDNIALLEKAFGLVADKTSYAGAMTKEYEAVAKTTAANLVIMGSRFNEIAVIVGSVLLPEIISLLKAITPAAQAFAAWAQAHPEMVRAAAALAIGFFGLRVAALAARLAFSTFTIAGGVLRMALGSVLWAAGAAARGAALLGRGVAAAGRLILTGGVAAVRALGTAVTWLGRAFLIAGRFMLANPIVAVIAAIAGLAYVIYANWDGIVAFFQEKIERVRAAFDEGLLNGVLKALAEFNPFTLSLDGAIGLYTYLTSGWDLSWLTDRLNAIGDINLYDAGVRIIRSLWDGAASILGAMVSAISAKLAAIMPAWMRAAWDWVQGGSGGEAAGKAPGRALGGPVRAGQIYRWLEEGEEVFSPSVDGSVVSNRELRALRAGGGRGARSVTFGDIVIHAAPGMSPGDVARAVRQELTRLTAGRGAELHDGGAYDAA